MEDANLANLEFSHTRLVQAFHRIRKVNISVMMDDVSQSEYFALLCISKGQRENPEREGIFVSELAEKLRIAPSQASRTLRNLEKRKLVGRSVDTKDRRNTYVYLTEEGQQICERTRKRIRAYVNKVCDDIGGNRIEELIQICNELADAMERELETYTKND